LKAGPECQVKLPALAFGHPSLLAKRRQSGIKQSQSCIPANNLCLHCKTVKKQCLPFLQVAQFLEMNRSGRTAFCYKAY
jgi:hypothetical protein